MDFDFESIARNVLWLFALGGFACAWARWGRTILGWSAVALFCAGEFGWALLVLWVWGIAEHEHGREMAWDRAAGFFNSDFLSWRRER